MTTVYLEVDGKPRPATKCNWLEIAPCGCTAGVSRAGYRYGDHVVTKHTGVDAFFADRPTVVRDYEVGRGLTFKLVTHEQYLAEYAPTMGPDSCPHTPKWGLHPLPMLDGWAWKTLDGSTSSGRPTYRRHLAPVEIPDRMQKVAALCGHESRGWCWSDDWHRLQDTVPCLNCLKRASTVTP